MRKSFLKSKTFWINLLMMLALILPEAFDLEILKVSKEISAFIIFIVNVVLRFITTGAIGVTDKPE